MGLREVSQFAATKETGREKVAAMSHAEASRETMMRCKVGGTMRCMMFGS